MVQPTRGALRQNLTPSDFYLFGQSKEKKEIFQQQGSRKQCKSGFGANRNNYLPTKLESYKEMGQLHTCWGVMRWTSTNFVRIYLILSYNRLLPVHFEWPPYIVFMSDVFIVIHHCYAFLFICFVLFSICSTQIFVSFIHFFLTIFY